MAPILVAAAARNALAAAPSGADVMRGQILYEARCGGCHSLDSNRVGPAHRGVVGRKVASAPGYAYSPAIRRLGGVWTAGRLDMWLKGPQRLAAGSRMFLSVDDPVARRDIIAYLATTSGKLPPGRK
jgi:cytochrome c